MLPEIIDNIFYNLWKVSKHHERYRFLSFWWSSTQGHLKQIAERKSPAPYYGKTVFLTYLISSMLPEIIHKILFSFWKIKETPWRTLFYFILMNFHSSTLKIDCRNENTRFTLWENSLFDLYNIIHVARNNSQDAF